MQSKCFLRLVFHTVLLRGVTYEATAGLRDQNKPELITSQMYCPPSVKVDARDQSTQSSLAIQMACNNLSTAELGRQPCGAQVFCLVSPFTKLPRECMMCSGMFRHRKGWHPGGCQRRYGLMWHQNLFVMENRMLRLWAKLKLPFFLKLLLSGILSKPWERQLILELCLGDGKTAILGRDACQ